MPLKLERKKREWTTAIQDAAAPYRGTKGPQALWRNAVGLHLRLHKVSPMIMEILNKIVSVKICENLC